MSRAKTDRIFCFAEGVTVDLRIEFECYCLGTALEGEASTEPIGPNQSKENQISKSRGKRGMGISMQA